jgi:hypothetical protein
LDQVGPARRRPFLFIVRSNSDQTPLLLKTQSGSRSIFSSWQQALLQVVLFW